MTLRVRVLASIGIVLFGLLALLSGIDRATLFEPGLSRLLPDGAQADALKTGAGLALASGDAEAARGLSATAIDADPLDPRPVGLLAAAQLSAREGAAHRTFELADRLGLRDPLVQAYFFDATMAAGEAEEAASRLDNLLRVHPRMAAPDYFFAGLEGSEDGRKELARRLAGDPVWGRAYLSAQGADDAVLRSRARFLSEQGEQVALGCGRIEPMLRELGKRNFRAEAQALAVAQCPERAMAQAVADAGFEAVGEDTAFGWRRHGSGDVRISSVGENDRSIELQNRSGVTRLVLSQPVALDAGEYRAFASVSGARPDSVIASLDCGRPSRPSSASGALGRGQLLRAPDCPDLVLGIWVKPGGDLVQVDNIRLEAVGR